MHLPYARNNELNVDVIVRLVAQTAAQTAVVVTLFM